MMRKTEQADDRSAIVAKNLVKVFCAGNVRALDGLSLSIESGEILGLIGPNGAGKTTFMASLLGLIQLSAGSISIDGKSPDILEIHRTLGYLPERLHFGEWMTGREFMLFHYRLLQLPSRGSAFEIEGLLDLVGLDRKSWTRKIKSYSRGMLQRLGMAQALLGSPRYLLLDEPSSGLDPGGVLLFRNLLLHLKERGVTIVLNSHQLDQIERVCDRVALVKTGRVESVDSIKNIRARSQSLVVRWPDCAERIVSGELLESIADYTESILEEFEFPRAKFAISGDMIATRIISELGAAGVGVAEASPDDSKLESFFYQQVPGGIV